MNVKISSVGGFCAVTPRQYILNNNKRNENRQWNFRPASSVGGYPQTIPPVEVAFLVASKFHIYPPTPRSQGER